MVNVSIAVPAFSSENRTAKALGLDCDAAFGTETRLFKLVPISGEQHDVGELVAVPTAGFNLSHIEATLTQRDELQHQLSKAKEAMSAMNDELLRLREHLSLNKTQRIKKLEDVNRKLQKSLE